MAEFVEYGRYIVIAYGDRKWRPSTTMIDQIECCTLSSYDYGLVMLLSEKAGCRRSFDYLKPSLANAPGYAALKRMRNEAQAQALVGNPPATPIKKRLLFDTTDPPSCEKQKRSRAEHAHLRNNPSMIEVVVEGHSIMMQKPVKANDDLVVAADKETLCVVLNYIVEVGLDSETLLTKRKYASRLPAGNRRRTVFSNGKTFVYESNGVETVVGDRRKNNGRRKSVQELPDLVASTGDPSPPTPKEGDPNPEQEGPPSPVYVANDDLPSMIDGGDSDSD